MALYRESNLMNQRLEGRSEVRASGITNTIVAGGSKFHGNFPASQDGRFWLDGPKIWTTLMIEDDDGCADSCTLN